MKNLVIEKIEKGIITHEDQENNKLSFNIIENEIGQNKIIEISGDAEIINTWKQNRGLIEIKEEEKEKIKKDNKRLGLEKEIIRLEEEVVILKNELTLL